MWYFKRHLCALLILGTVAINASAANYHFVNIADTRGSFVEFDYWAQAVSDTGTVAFIGYQGGVYGSYIGDGTSINTVVPDLSPPSGFSGQGTYGLNEFGTAASTAAALASGTKRILLHEPSGTRTIAEVTSSNEIMLTLDFPAINNSGAVAFGVFADSATSPPTHQGSITRWFDGTSTTVVETTAGFNVVTAVGINEAGDVAFKGFKESEGGSYHRTDGTTLTQIADSTGPLNITQESLIAPTAINDSGAVALWTELDAGGEGILVGNGGPLTTVAIADETTPFSNFSERIDINNQGTVAFAASLWDGGYGIFTGPDPVNDKVIALDDLLFGRPVSDLGGLHLNERGDIAFWFIVDDPSVPNGEWRGIALAVKESPPTGDYNGDGTVDAADYVLWRKTGGSQDDYETWRAQFGETTGATPGDFNGDGKVDAADYVLWRKTDGTQQGYNTWRTNFGRTAGSGSGGALGPTAQIAVPEPASVLLLALGVVACGLRTRSKRQG